MSDDTDTVRHDDRYYVKSVGRAFAALEILADAGPDGLTLSELSRALRTSKSGTHAILHTLLVHGVVASTGTGLTLRFRLGMALARLGDLVTSQVELRDVTLPVLRSLTSSIELMSRVAVLDDEYAVPIATVDVNHGNIRFHANLGRREPLHCSAVGKAILSTLPSARVREIIETVGLPRHTARTITDVDTLLRELDGVRRRGFAVDDEEDAEGIFCVGAPFFDRSGSCVGAISATGLKVELSLLRIEETGQTVAEHAARISALLGLAAVEDDPVAQVTSAAPA